MKKIKKIIDILLKLSIIKTLNFNLKYFGLKGFILPVLIGKNVEFKKLEGKVLLKIFKPFMIKIAINEMGHFSSKHTYTIFDNQGTIQFNGKANIGIGTAISNNGLLDIGNNLIITASCIINCFSNIKLGNDCLISWNTQIIDSDVHKIYKLNSNEQLNPDKEIVIGNHCWICNGVSVNKGSIIPSNCIIASNSIINKELFEENCIIGNLGKIIKRNIKWSM